MKSSVPGLTFAAFWLVALASAAQDLPLRPVPREPRIASRPRTNDSSASGDSNASLIHRVVVAMDAHQAISARLRQRVDLFGHQLVGSGAYLQQGRGSDRLLRLELKIQVEDQTTSLEQVCDGQNLWSRQELLGKAIFGRIDLKRVKEAIAENQSPAAVQSSAAWLALGGLPRLLQALDDSFVFADPTEGKLDDLAVWTLEGQWKPYRLAELLPDEKANLEAGKSADTSKLAAHVPERVRLQVGRDDMFPYRLEYLRRASVDKKNKDKTPSGSETWRELVLMEMFEVELDAPVDKSRFAYKPGNQEPSDHTADFLRSIGITEEPATSARPTAPVR